MLIAGNWKMFKGPAETRAFCVAFDPPAGIDIVLCPPFVSLAAALGGRVPVYAQNVHWADKGAFTGEISAPMLLELGVTGTLVAHSERRQYFGETDETVAERTAHALDAGLQVITCVGELEEERERGLTEKVLARQLALLEPHPALTIAYEPVWAIGTGKTATPEVVQETHAFIKGLLPAPVLYGGSVKPENTEELLSQQDVDGALVGGASLDPATFETLCRIAASLS